MFTGIVESVGKVLTVRPVADGICLELDPGLDLSGDRIGDSIAVDGVCLTVTSLRGSCFSAMASGETLARSTLGRLAAGSRVNLERALTLSARLGGHIVLGHVDATAGILQKVSRGETTALRVSLPAEFARYLVPKGSIAVDGISLTVNRILEDAFELLLIPHTMCSTTLTGKGSGDRVNLEFDVLGKYVERLLGRESHEKASVEWESLLRKQGFI